MRKLHFLWNHTFSQFLHLTFARCLVETKRFVPPAIDDLLLKCWQWRIFHTVVSWLTGSKDENFHNDGQNHIKNNAMIHSNVHLPWKDCVSRSQEVGWLMAGMQLLLFQNNLNVLQVCYFYSDSFFSLNYCPKMISILIQKVHFNH